MGKVTLKIAATQADHFTAMQVRHMQRRRYPSWHFPPKGQGTGTPDTLGFLHPLFSICEQFSSCLIQCALWSVSRDLPVEIAQDAVGRYGEWYPVGRTFFLTQELH